jgi:hypothetical protein
MKRLFVLSILLSLFLFASQEVSAQFTFFNGSGCSVRVLGGFNYNSNPCNGPTCTTPWVSVAPGTSVTLPTAGVPCLTPVFPPPPANFFGFKLLVSSTSGTSVDICSNPVSAIADCNGVPRTVQIFNFNFGAIF